MREISTARHASLITYARRLPPADSVVKVRTIRFVDLPFDFTSGGGRRTDPAKPGMIRFGKIAVFSEIQKLFSIRKPADSTVKVHTIRFVDLLFAFASPGVPRIDAWRQSPRDSRQQLSGSCGRSGPANNSQSSILRVIWWLL